MCRVRSGRRLAAYWLQFALCSLALGGCSGKSAQVTTPDRPKAHAHLQEAERLLDAKKLNEAMAEAKRAKEADPTLPLSYFVCADIHAASGHFKAKQDELVAAYQAIPDDYEVMVRLLYGTQGNFPPADAEAIAKKAVKLRSDSAEAHYFVGLAIVNGGDPTRRQEALLAFETSNKLNAGATMPLTEMGKLLLQLGQTTRALAILESDGALLDTGKPRGTVPPAIVEDWLKQRRAVAFWTADALRRLGRHAEARKASGLAAKLSAKSSELRMLNSKVAQQPPDPAARRRLDKLLNGAF